VNVPRQAASALDSGKEDVGVALVELAIRLFLLNDLLLLDTPEL
jgi:hypothetical protein